jgi:hypothetical protein
MAPATSFVPSSSGGQEKTTNQNTWCNGQATPVHRTHGSLSPTSSEAERTWPSVNTSRKNQTMASASCDAATLTLDSYR